MTETYQEYRDKVKTEQSGMSKEDIEKLLRSQAEFVADLDNLVPQKHQWVDRGLVISCEGAGHPSHRSFKRR